MAFGRRVSGDRRSRSTDEPAARPADSQDRSMRASSARRGSARSALSEETKESGMRAIFVAALVSVGIVLLGVSPGSAAPGSGALATAANLNREVDQLHWRADQACAGVGETDPARREHATREKKASQIKAVGDVLGRGFTGARLAQERR